MIVTINPMLSSLCHFLNMKVLEIYIILYVCKRIHILNKKVIQIFESLFKRFF